MTVQVHEVLGMQLPDAPRSYFTYELQYLRRRTCKPWTSSPVASKSVHLPVSQSVVCCCRTHTLWETGTLNNMHWMSTTSASASRVLGMPMQARAGFSPTPPQFYRLRGSAASSP